MTTDTQRVLVGVETTMRGVVEVELTAWQSMDQAQELALDAVGCGDVQPNWEVQGTKALATWVRGADCHLVQMPREGLGGTYSWCHQHLSSAKGDATRCYAVDELERLAK